MQQVREQWFALSQSEMEVTKVGGIAAVGQGGYDILAVQVGHTEPDRDILIAEEGYFLVYDSLAWLHDKSPKIWQAYVKRTVPEFIGKTFREAMEYVIQEIEQG